MKKLNDLMKCNKKIRTKNSDVIIGHLLYWVLQTVTWVNCCMNNAKIRRVLSETKAIMSHPYVTGWNHFFCRGR